MPKPEAASYRNSRKACALVIRLWSYVIWLRSLGEFVAESQPNRMSRLKSAWRPINRLPSRRPFAGVTIVWGSVEPQPGNDCERVTFARVDRDPFASAAFTITAKLRWTDRWAEQTGRAKHVGDCAGTIVTVIIEWFVAAAVPVALVAKLIACPDGAFYRERRSLGRSCVAKTKPGDFARSDRPFCRKKIGRRRWKDQSWDDDAEQDLAINRIDKFLRVRLLQKESRRWKGKITKFLSSRRSANALRTAQVTTVCCFKAL